jgi:uncharacterized protein (DUF4415 family)
MSLNARESALSTRAILSSDRWCADPDVFLVHSGVTHAANSSGRFKFAILNLCYECIAESRHDNMDGYMSFDRPRRTDPRLAAEAIFKPAPPKAPPPNKPSIPGAKELVSLRIDRDILSHFQEGGPGWQDRINSALRKFVAK